MTAYLNLKQISDEQAALIDSAVQTVGSVVLARRVVSGIRWRGDLMVTAAEALDGADRVAVRLENAEVSAQVIALDLRTDVAVLRVAEPAPAAARVSAVALRVGETVAIVGSDGRGPTAVWGSLQFIGPAWTSRRGGTIGRRLEIDARFDPALEGAAVLDMDGAIVAMAVPAPRRRVLGIPADTIERVVALVERHGHLPQPYIGVRPQSLWLDESTREQLGRAGRRIAAVSGVDPGSPAATADLELGDLLLSVDGAPAESEALAHRVGALSPGEAIEIEVLRGGKPQPHIDCHGPDR